MTKENQKHISIVNRLHWHNRGQAFFTGLWFDLLLALTAMATWIFTLESTVVGEGWSVMTRSCTWTERTLPAALDQLFRGLRYTVTLTNDAGHTKLVSFDASHAAFVLLVGLVAVILAQCLFGWFGSAADRRSIRRILRPIDDIAMNAERISQSSRLFADRGEKEMLESLASALDNIDALSEDASIHVQERELSGLEAAVNNMLRRLAQSQKEQIRFVDDASHELRTPIAVIQGYAGMLDRWGKDDPSVMEESITAIKTEAEHMKTLVEQLLFLARGESDRLEMHVVPVDGCEILRELWEEYRMIDPAHQYTLSLPEKETPLWVAADVALLKQSLRTMLDNAQKFTPKGGLITLTGKCISQGEGEAQISLEIADSGIGIPKEDLPRLFDRFWRGSSARSGVPGSGLGLSIARWIVERHNGRIDVASAPGVGTKIAVVLQEKQEGIPPLDVETP